MFIVLNKQAIQQRKCEGDNIKCEGVNMKC